MSFTLLSVAILVITAAIIYRQVRLGYKHGLSRSLIKLAILLSCAFFAAIISVAIVSTSDAVVNYLLKIVGLYDILSKILGGFMLPIMMVVKMLLSLILYLPVFFILRCIVSVVIKIVYAVLVKKRGKQDRQYLSEDESLYIKKDKKIGALLGVISGFILSVVIFMPFIGALRSANDIINIIKINTDIAAIEDSEELKLIDKYSKDFSGTVINACGGGVLYDLTTMVYYGDQSTYLNREIEIIKNINIKDLKDDIANEGDFNIDSIEILEPTLDNINESLVLKLAAVEVVRDASQTWLNNGEYLGIPRPNIGTHRATQKFLNELLVVCSTTTFDTYDGDITTLLNIIEIFQQNEELLSAGDYSSLSSALTEGGFLQRVEEELNKNPHMSALSSSINEMIMVVISEEISSMTKYSDVARELLYKELASALSDTQGLTGSVRDVEVSNYISESFLTFGVDIPEGITGRIATVLVDQVPVMDGRVTDKEVRKYFDECLN